MFCFCSNKMQPCRILGSKTKTAELYSVKRSLSSYLTSFERLLVLRAIVVGGEWAIATDIA